MRSHVATLCAVRVARNDGAATFFLAAATGRGYNRSETGPTAVDNPGGAMRYDDDYDDDPTDPIEVDDRIEADIQRSLDRYHEEREHAAEVAHRAADALRLARGGR